MQMGPPSPPSLVCQLNSANKYREEPRNLSDQEMAVMVNYAKYKAFTNFRSGHAGEIAAGNSCPSEGCI